MDAVTFGSKDRIQIVDRLFGEGLFVENDVIEASQVSHFLVRDLEPTSTNLRRYLPESVIPLFQGARG